MTPSGAFLAALVLPCLYAAWSDLRTMTIPNWLVLLCIGIYIVIGGLFVLLDPAALPLATWAWRFVPALVVLVIGFVLNLTGQFGAGDAKFATAIALFVQPQHLADIFVIYAATTLLSVLVMTIVKRSMKAEARAASGLRSLRENRRFPLGLPLAITALIYLGLVVQRGG